MMPRSASLGVRPNLSSRTNAGLTPRVQGLRGHSRGTVRPWLRSVTRGSPGSRSLGVLIVVVDRVWLLATPSDEYVLLPDDPHPADAVVSVGGVKPKPRATAPASTTSTCSYTGRACPSRGCRASRTARPSCPRTAIVPPGGSQSDLDRVDHLTFTDSRTVAGVVALRALGRKVTVAAHGRDVRRRRAPAPAYARRPAPRHGDHGDRRRPGAQVRTSDSRCRAASRVRRSASRVSDGKRNARAPHEADERPAGRAARHHRRARRARRAAAGEAAR